MDPSPAITQTATIREESKPNLLSYTTFYSPSWTAFEGNSSNSLDTTSPGQHPEPTQTVQRTATGGRSSEMTAYSDYSTPPTFDRPLVLETESGGK
ncbi:hypothetical protein FPHYL_3693 [Fusarium phyllophilum]|uniref:Uncharacterized protein n=1 Tax=Fusarium phyllophilum TaxID=47803 RepID=A0A8H5NHG1_9HYPO|nr:hypothetical protein FPHYL_3693 [Fusarium phyllophilum]